MFDGLNSKAQVQIVPIFTVLLQGIANLSVLGLGTHNTHPELLSNLVYGRTESGGIPTVFPLIDAIDELDLGEEVSELTEPMQPSSACLSAHGEWYTRLKAVLTLRQFRLFCSPFVAEWWQRWTRDSGDPAPGARTEQGSSTRHFTCTRSRTASRPSA